MTSKVSSITKSLIISTIFSVVLPAIVIALSFWNTITTTIDETIWSSNDWEIPNGLMVLTPTAVNLCLAVLHSLYLVYLSRSNPEVPKSTRFLTNLRAARAVFWVFSVPILLAAGLAALLTRYSWGFAAGILFASGLTQLVLAVWYGQLISRLRMNKLLASQAK